MTTHATAFKQWTESELDSLAVENQFRLRGLEVTRLDTFIDAAFAFVLTLLVISFDQIPSNFDELSAAIKRIPAFAASFAIMMMFWLQHRRWSRCYGLENSKTVLLSLALIFMVLVYVYPLRMLFEGMFHGLSDGYLPSSYQVTTYVELRMTFVFYSAGYFAMSLIISHLYRAVMKNSAPLGLNKIELQRTRITEQGWAFSAGFGLLSILMALVLPDSWVVVAGYMYVLLFFTGPIVVFFDRRRHGDSESAA